MQVGSDIKPHNEDVSYMMESLTLDDKNMNITGGGLYRPLTVEDGILGRYIQLTGGRVRFNANPYGYCDSI